MFVCFKVCEQVSLELQKKTQKKIFFPVKIIKINSLKQQKKSSETEIDFESKKNYHPGNIKINLKKNPKKKICEQYDSIWQTKHIYMKTE